jgi:hypothetical protein
MAERLRLQSAKPDRSSHRMDTTTPSPSNLLNLHRALLDGFAIETRVYEPDGSHVDWVLSPLKDGGFHLQETPVEVWQDVGSVGMASYAGKTVVHECARAELLAQLRERLGPDPYVNELPPPLHQPADPRVRFEHCLGNFTLDLPEGTGLHSLLVIPFVVLLCAVMISFMLIPFLNGWRQGNWLFFLLGVGGLALFGRLFIPYAVDSYSGLARLKVEGWNATLTRGRAWWWQETKFRWDHVVALDFVVTRTSTIRSGATLTTAWFILDDGSRVPYAMMQVKRPWQEAVKILLSLLAARKKQRERSDP